MKNRYYCLVNFKLYGRIRGNRNLDYDNWRGYGILLVRGSFMFCEILFFLILLIFIFLLFLFLFLIL